MLIMTLHGCSLLDNAGAYCPEDEQSDVGHGCPFNAVTSKIALNGGSHLISSAEGIQSGLEFIHLLGVAVATTSNKKRTPPPLLTFPWNPTESLFSRTFNNPLAQTTNPADLSSLNNGSPRHPVSGRGLPLLVSHFIAEMGIGVFGAGRLLNWCNPRAALVEDPDLSKMDSRLNTSGMTASTRR